MFNEFHHMSFLGMNPNSETFIVKEDQKLHIEVLQPISSIPTSEFADGCQSTSSDRDKEEATDSDEDPKKPFLGESEVADDDDGFRTPTSSDHKISSPTICPPAPRKPRPHPPAKRKASPPPTTPGNILHLDLSKEVESMFPPSLRADLGRKIKRARKESPEKIGT